MPHVDLTNLKKEKTLSFTVMDRSGRVVRWEVPPFDNETEHAYWEWSDNMFEQRKLEQEYQMGLIKNEAEATEKPTRVTVAEVWAPLVTLAVKAQGESEDSMSPVELQEAELMRDYESTVLAGVGGEIASFFLTGKTQAQERAEKQEQQARLLAFQQVATTGNTTSAKSGSGSRKRSTKS